MTGCEENCRQEYSKIRALVVKANRKKHHLPVFLQQKAP
jgi:hypothetical protein